MREARRADAGRSSRGAGGKAAAGPFLALAGARPRDQAGGPRRRPIPEPRRRLLRARPAARRPAERPIRLRGGTVCRGRASPAAAARAGQESSGNRIFLRGCRAPLPGTSGSRGPRQPSCRPPSGRPDPAAAGAGVPGRGPAGRNLGTPGRIRPYRAATDFARADECAGVPPQKRRIPRRRSGPRPPARALTLLEPCARSWAS